MSAEAIAAVVADLRHNRVRNMLPNNPRVMELALPLAKVGPVVDATAIYDSLVAVPRQIALYEDHPCVSPPWEAASICYTNDHGNVIVMAASATELTSRSSPQWDATAHEVDWERVRWRVDAFLWLGGRSDQRGEFPTTGPVHLWQLAIYDSGEPADIHWVHLVPDYPQEHWDMALTVLLQSLNFMNCRNVLLVEPQRPRAERRRLARFGVGIHTINVFPIGRSSRALRGVGGQGTPLTSVRGHFATYGPEHDRGLLFGRLAGRFWIPQHARGDASQGISDHDYRLIP